MERARYATAGSTNNDSFETHHVFKGSPTGYQSNPALAHKDSDQYECL